MASVSSALFSTQMYDANGNMTRPWVLFFTALAAALTGTSTETGGGSLLFTVPGTIGIRSNAAPLIQAPDGMTFSTAVALVKQAPVGAAINVALRDAGNVIGTVAIAAGATSGSVTLSSGSVSAGDLLTIDITAVGTTFPGSDLTVQLEP